ncbi:BlaR1 family beta-lactam sensor/signal transducer [Lachnospiraceae bacterium]|nr:BlaR1 family beta-lactam sensor/signal transducer [Lachnospiraceae bacterium]
MADFMIRFLICNLFICALVGILLAARHLLRNILSGRMQYHLWFLLLGLLTVPFLPFRLTGFPMLLARLLAFCNPALPDTGNIVNQGDVTTPAGDSGWLNDFTLSISNQTPSIAGTILLGIWLAGILVMVVLTARSSLRLQNIRQSALPLQNPAIRRLYRHCLKELHIRKEIPIYSTAFLQSPVIIGFLRPHIYLPIHIISDYSKIDTDKFCQASCGSSPSGMNGLHQIRYMLLHELQHYRHKDALAGYLMTLTGILYWFNPMVWIALKEMRNDREIACDTSVLNMLEPDSYEDYGMTLIHFAEKLSRPAFPFAAGLSGNMSQMKRRILNIAAYETPTAKKRLTGMTAFLMVTVLLTSLAPLLSANAAKDDYYGWDTSHKNINVIDLSSCFQGYEGSFVLYNMAQDTWNIYDMDRAALRVSPDSTYKIYDALFGLEAGAITPEASAMEWNHELYSFQEWNADQTLQSAMSASVNWYFQEIDKQLGLSGIDRYLREIRYGNENTKGGLSSYWMESSLKISPIEQVELLRKLYENNLGFGIQNVNAVKDSILLSSSEAGNLYGKTGTGCIDGKDVNGWFVGYVEAPDNTWFFAANIAANDDASGNSAAEITQHILSKINIWH